MKVPGGGAFVASDARPVVSPSPRVGDADYRPLCSAAGTIASGPRRMPDETAEGASPALNTEGPMRADTPERPALEMDSDGAPSPLPLCRPLHGVAEQETQDHVTPCAQGLLPT